MAGGDIESALDDLAATLGASLALEDTEQRLLAHTDPGEVIDAVRLASILGRRATPEVRGWFEQWGILEATGPIRTPAGPGIGALARWCVPVRQGGRLLGYIWVLDDGHLPADALAPAVEAAEEIAPALSRRRRAEHADAELARDLVDPGGGAGDLRQRFLHRGPVVVAALGTASATPDPGAIREIAVATRRAAEELADGTTATAPLGDHVLAILPLRSAVDLDPPRRFVERAQQLTGRQARGIDVVIGLSASRSSVAAAPAAHVEARRTLAIVRAVPRTGPIGWWDGLGAYRVLAALGADSSTLVDPRVALLAADDELAATATAFLDRAGDVGLTATVINVHRATLYHRLSRIRERTGLDLQRSGDDRLAAHLGLRVLELHG